VRISQGTINASPSQVAQGGGVASGGKGVVGAAAQATSNANDLLQRRWDYRKPLVLLGPTLSSATARSLEEALPRLPWLEFDGLRLGFGPNLRVVLPAIANFTTGGSLRLSGPLSPELRASGVVRLLKGRLNLFTSTFSLDPDTPNVAVFTPSLGLVPYLDIAMRSRIADNRTLPLSSSLSTGETTALPILSEKDNPTGFTNFNQLNLILVTVSVSGAADELAQNIRLRSTPPLPQERLLALIGGNSLAGLQGGEAGTALATALGQSLLSPLLGSLTDALGQRVSLALYPTYVNQAISDGSLTNGERVAPQLVLAAEVGYDLTSRLNASLLAAPNRSDVPPQFNLNYKATNNLSLEGSVDTEGTWQTQLQLFLRF
jgi:translocation and assembly module TamB